MATPSSAERCRASALALETCRSSALALEMCRSSVGEIQIKCTSVGECRSSVLALERWLWRGADQVHYMNIIPKVV